MIAHKCMTVGTNGTKFNPATKSNTNAIIGNTTSQVFAT